MPTPRVPTAILEARGSYAHDPQRRKLRAGEPKPTGELGDPPEELSAAEREAWAYLAGLLPEGVAKDMDRAAFEELACLRVICKTGRAKAAERLLYKCYLSLFGMTPADRSKVKADKQPKKQTEVDEFIQ